VAARANKIVPVREEVANPLVAIDTMAAWAFLEQLDCSAVRTRVCDSVSDLTRKMYKTVSILMGRYDMMRKNLPAEMQLSAGGFHRSCAFSKVEVSPRKTY